MKKCLLYCFMLLLFSKSYGTHIVGGEIYYDCLGNNNYLITLKVYRDCYNGLAPFDDPAWIGIYDANGFLVDTMALPFPGSVQLANQVNNPCFIPPTDVCVEEAVYTGTINLPPLPGGYYLSYQRCCRNNTILNLINPGGVGSTYTIQIPDPGLAICNSSPRYNTPPMVFVCDLVPIYYDHSATDPDGDSLVYEFCDPLDGASSLNPLPVPPSGPPYLNVPFLSPYNAQYPLSSNPALNVDQFTGFLTGTPDLQGQWVGAVCVKEYRNGQLLSINRRDFQYNVINCPGLVVSSIPSQQTYCFGMNVNFLNNSANAVSYFWDFDDPNSTSDTSSQFTPSYTYSDTGIYNVMLVCNPNTICADTSFTSFYIYPPVQPSFVPPPPQCLVGNSYSFLCGGSIMGTGTYGWNFGPTATPSTSALSAPSGITFNSAGTFPVTITVYENGCSGSFTDSVEVLAMPQLTGTLSSDTLCVPGVKAFPDPLTSVSGFSVNYSWDFGDGNISNLSSPTHIYSLPGIYDVTFEAIISGGCSDTFNITEPQLITVSGLPTAGIATDTNWVDLMDPVITMYNSAVNETECYTDFGDGVIISGCGDSLVHEYEEMGLYTIRQIVMNQYGCSDTAKTKIEVWPSYMVWVPNAFTPNGDGLNDFFKPELFGVVEYNLLIFDRWGELIFESVVPETGWDGKYKDEKCPLGVYVYKLTYVDQQRFREHIVYGHVSLIR